MPPDEVRWKVHAYLDKQKKRLPLMSVDAAMLEVRIWVVEAKGVSDTDLRSMVVGYYLLNSVRLPALTTPNPLASRLADADIVKAVRAAMTVAVNGIDIGHEGGKINISVTGVTGELTKGDAKLSMGVSWGGTLSLEAAKGPFHFSGELSKDSWSVTLSYPADTAVPDMSKLGGVFGESEKAMRGIIGATKGFSHARDIPKVVGNMTPYMKPVGEAIEAVKGIAKAPANGPSVGIKFGSPDPMPGQTGMPGGIQATVTITWTF